MANVQRPLSRGRGRGRGWRGNLPPTDPFPVGLAPDAERPKLSPTGSFDSGVTTASDSLLSGSPVISSSPVSLTEVQVCRRPDFGSRGVNVPLRTNHFVIDIPPNTVLSRYEVNMTLLKGTRSVELSSKSNTVEQHLRRDAAFEVYKQMVERNPKSFGRVFAQYYDRSHQLFTLEKLPCGDRASFTIKGVKTELDEGDKVATGSDYLVKLEWIEFVRIDDLSEVIAATEKQKDFVVLQILDLISSQSLYMSQHFSQFGRSFYQIPKIPVDLGNGRTMGVGFNKSHRPILGNWKEIDKLPPPDHCVISLNINTTKTAFYTVQPVLEFLYQVTGVDFFRVQLRPPDWRRFFDEIRGVFVEHSYSGKKGRFAVKRLSPLAANQQTYRYAITVESIRFSFVDFATQKEVTVEKYFKIRYDVTLKYPYFPCLVHFLPGRRTSYVPLELCEVSANQRVNRKRVNEQQTSEIIKKTAIPPEERRREIMDVVTKELVKPNCKTDPFLDELEIERSAEMLECTGRIIKPPMIQYKAKNNQPVSFAPNNGQWDCKTAKFILPATCRQFALIFVGGMPSEKQDWEIGAFLDALHAVATEKGLQWPKKPTEKRLALTTAELEAQFKHLTEKHSRAEDFIDVILVVNDKKNKGAYGEVKRLGETIYDVATSCILPKTVGDVANNWSSNDPRNVNKAKTTCFQLALKINSKLGGVSSEVSDENHNNKVVSRYMKQPILFMGADVTHPPPQPRHEVLQGIPPREPSIAAIVASRDGQSKEYTTVIQVQNPRREPIDRLQEAVEQSIEEFVKTTKKRPERIIFYRDGVSDGQVYEILTNEVVAIRNACRSAYVDYEPPITFINVQKRHNTRFFPTPPAPANARNYEKNVAAGTVVDVGPVHPQRFEFFLTSQQGIQGTSRPTKYTVLHDDNGFCQDDLQALTFYLCHAYVRCTKSVSLPAPVYYAHLAAARAKDVANQQIQKVEGESSSSGESLTDVEGQWMELERKIKVLPKMAQRLYFS